MRVLVLGVTGMLGHKLWQTLNVRFETWGAARAGYSDYADLGIFSRERFIGGVDAFNPDSVIRAFTVSRPDVVVNAVGIVKQLPTAKDPITSLTINSLFPHRLSALCRTAGARLIHIGTDCVFSGKAGPYTESSLSDAEDLYGRSKYLGEVSGPGSLTLRTSIIGRELHTTNGLVEWFLNNRDRSVRGFTEAHFSGFTTLALAELITDVIQKHYDLEGLFQVSSDPISKYDLLRLIRDTYALGTEIIPSEDIRVNRVLDSSRFRSVTGFAPAPWPDMIAAMSEDPTPYHQWARG